MVKTSAYKNTTYSVMHELLKPIVLDYEDIVASAHSNSYCYLLGSDQDQSSIADEKT